MIKKEIFSLSLKLEKPWHIKEILFEKPELKKFGRLTIQMDFEKGAKYTV
ncbi:MAG TPA: hypothetical protein PLK25_04960 [Bacteroidales bacterium]|nr:hypothetical protein [Bacteroidales bacterium]HRC79039.1 hypothetical protein [Bacteroidales bacterium]